MSNLRNILNAEYSKESRQMTPNSLMKMIEEVLEFPLSFTINEETEGKTQTLTISMIPDIEVSELGWADVRTPDGGGAPIKSRERELLEGYLKNIVGESGGMEALPQKLDALSSLADNPAQFIKSGAAGTSPAEQIKTVISFLVFYKTLTKILANFNASAAGFNFESFLATLLGGKQIPATGADTIADFVDERGTLVSLKLYKEKTVEVGGSFEALVEDLVRDGKMTYLVVTKDLKGDREALDGVLKFYKFDFTLDNVMEILQDTKAFSARCIILPLGEDSDAPQEEVPEKVQIVPADIHAAFVENLSAAIDNQEITAAITADPHFQYGTDEMLSLAYVGSRAGEGKMRRYKLDAQNRSRVEQIIRGLASVPEDADTRSIARAIKGALDAVVDGLAAQRAARKEKIGQVRPTFKKYVLPQGSSKSGRNKTNINRIAQAAAASADVYRDLDETQKKRALLNSNGYLNELQFVLNRGEVVELARGQKGSGDDAEPIEGTLRIGAASLQSMLNESVAALNTNVFSIFGDLQVLSDSLNSFFAGGLQDTTKAESAIKSADDIEGKTEELKPQ
jgi:hypothetical protein